MKLIRWIRSIVRSPELGPEYSDTLDFWGDENLNKRARPAMYADVAPSPNEDIEAAVSASWTLQQIREAGGTLDPISVDVLCHIDDIQNSAKDSEWNRFIDGWSCKR